MANGKIVTKVSVAISCTVFTVFVISGSIFATYLLNKLDLLESEVSYIVVLSVIYIV